MKNLYFYVRACVCMCPSLCHKGHSPVVQQNCGPKDLKKENREKLEKERDKRKKEQ